MIDLFKRRCVRYQTPRKAVDTVPGSHPKQLAYPDGKLGRTTLEKIKPLVLLLLDRPNTLLQAVLQAPAAMDFAFRALIVVAGLCKLGVGVLGVAAGDVDGIARVETAATLCILVVLHDVAAVFHFDAVVVDPVRFHGAVEGEGRLRFAFQVLWEVFLRCFVSVMYHKRLACRWGNLQLRATSCILGRHQCLPSSCRCPLHS